MTKERIDKTENRAIEMILSDNKEKKKTEEKYTEAQRLRGQYQQHQHTYNKSSRRREKETEFFFEEILAKNFTNLMKNINLQV